MTGEDQISRFIARLPGDKVTEVDPNAPAVVFESALQLNRPQEEEMVDWILKRFEELKSELGYDQTASTEGGAWYTNGGAEAISTSKTFFGRRQLYEMIYNNEVEWRRTMLGGIYEDHNLVVPSSRRVVQQQISRANNYMFGSDPWVTVSPVGSDDREFASNVDRWVKDRFERNGVKEAHQMANQGAFIRGEACLKTTWQKKLDYFESNASILIDPATDEPAIAEDGDYIFEDDVWIDMGSGEMVLKRDQKTVQPDYMMSEGGELNEGTFQVRKVNRALTKFEGAEDKEVYWRDFLCPLDAETVEDADMCCHVFDKEAIDIATMLIDKAQGDPDGDKMPKIIEILNNLSANTGESKSQANLPRAEEGEESTNDLGTANRDPRVNMGEFWIHYDPYGDGRGRRSLVVLLDIDNRAPIYYDYVANVTPEGYRPFHIPRVNPVNGRWHGTGNMEVYWPLQEMIDLLANRWNMSQSASARVDFWNPTAVYEGDDEPNLKLNGGNTYTLKPGYQAEDALSTVILTDIKSDRIHEQIMFLQQHMMNMSGVANANDANSAGLDSAQLATGIRNIHDSGMELFNPWLNHLMPGHKSAVQAMIYLEIENMSEEDIFHFYEDGVRRLGKISRGELRYLDFDIRIELTRFRTEREIEQTERAYAAFHRFYSLPTPLQYKWEPVAKRSMGNLEMPDPDQIIEIDYFSMAEMMGMPPDPATTAVNSGMGSSKPGVM